MPARIRNETQSQMRTRLLIVMAISAQCVMFACTSRTQAEKRQSCGIVATLTLITLDASTPKAQENRQLSVAAFAACLSNDEE